MVTGGSAGKADRRFEALLLSTFFVFGFSVVFILMATSTTANAQAGMLYLATYSLGLALPFLASTLLLNKFSHYRGSLGKWSACARPVAGVILVLMGLLIVSGTLTRLSSILVDWFPALATIG